MTSRIIKFNPIVYAASRITERLTGYDLLMTPGRPAQPIVQQRTPPRRFQYPVSVNMAPLPRRDYANLLSFEMLRSLVRAHTVGSLCVRVRCEHIASLDGAVVAKNKNEQRSVQRDCDTMSQILDRPDGITMRSVWLKTLMREILEIDAACLYPRRTFGGGVSGIEIVDGSTIKPILGLSGCVVGYQQVLYGMALSQYLRRPVSGHEELVLDEYASDELFYQPYWPSVSSPYGRPPIEDLYNYASIAIQKQAYDLSHFTDGNIPAALAVFDAEALNVDQVIDFEADFNADLQANPSRAGYMKFVPFPVRIERLKELTEGGRYESAQEEFNVKITCGHFGVTPAEIGFTADVNKATAEGQENTTYRIGIKPMAEWIKHVVFDPMIAAYGYHHLQWQWNYGESEDRLMNAQIDNIYASLGVVTAQELRTMRYPDLASDSGAVV